MSTITIALLMVIGLFVCVLIGIHIGFSLALMATIGIILISGSFDTGIYILATTTFEALRSYTFAVIPLFMLMGSFMSNSSIAKDMFAFLARILKIIPGGLGVATVFANAIFAAVTGVSIASAAIFARVAVPEMERHRYLPSFAAGTVAGSSVLGMLIPPSLMFILYGYLAEVSIGKMFIAGIIPGILLALMFSVMIIIFAKFRPNSVYLQDFDEQMAEKQEKFQQLLEETSEVEEASMLRLSIAVIPTALLIVIVLGGIWGGFFTPTEASAFGAMGALIIGFFTHMGIKGFLNALLETAGAASSILFLLICATMYSRMLTMSGVIVWLSGSVMNLEVSRYIILALLMVVIILLGCVLDSTSIMLVTVPMMAPIMSMLGFDLIWYGVIMVLFVHMGLLTPPFGMCVFAVKGALSNRSINVEQIFSKAMPFLIVMLIHAIICVLFPALSTWLPTMMS